MHISAAVVRSIVRNFVGIILSDHADPCMATIYPYKWLTFMANSWVNYISRIDPLGMTKANVPNITCRSFQIYTPPKSCFLQIPQKKRCVFLQIAPKKNHWFPPKIYTQKSVSSKPKYFLLLKYPPLSYFRWAQKHQSASQPGKLKTSRSWHDLICMYLMGVPI